MMQYMMMYPILGFCLISEAIIGLTLVLVSISLAAAVHVDDIDDDLPHENL